MSTLGHLISGYYKGFLYYWWHVCMPGNRNNYFHCLLSVNSYHLLVEVSLKVLWGEQTVVLYR